MIPPGLEAVAIEPKADGRCNQRPDCQGNESIMAIAKEGAPAERHNDADDHAAQLAATRFL